MDGVARPRRRPPATILRRRTWDDMAADIAAIVERSVTAPAFDPVTGLLGVRRQRRSCPSTRRSSSWRSTRKQDPELAAYSGARVTLQRCRACGFAQPAALPALPRYLRSDVRPALVRRLDRGRARRRLQGSDLRGHPRGARRTACTARPRAARRRRARRPLPRGSRATPAGTAKGSSSIRRPPPTPRSGPGAPVHQGNIHTFTPARCYDAVTLTDVLEHVPQPAGRAGARRARFSAPGGWLAIKVPNGPASASRRRCAPACGRPTARPSPTIWST